MEYSALVDFYNDLRAVVDEGDDEKTQRVLSEKFAHLPEDIQGELLVRLYFSAIEDEARDAEAIADIQTRGLAALEALDLLKQKIDAGEGSANT